MCIICVSGIGRPISQLHKSPTEKEHIKAHLHADLDIYKKKKEKKSEEKRKEGKHNNNIKKKKKSPFLWVRCSPSSSTTQSSKGEEYAMDSNKEK